MITVGDVRLHYTSRGKGRSMVFLHGIGGTLHNYDVIAKELVGAWRIVAYDHRGFGKSDKPLDKPYSTESWADDLSQLLARLHIRKAVVVGHSMGGRIACHFAAKYPEQASALIILDTTMWGSSPEGATELRVGIRRLPKEGMKVFANNTPWARSLDPKYRLLSRMDQEETLANDPAAYALAAESVASDFAGETDSSFLSKIRCPTLIVVGDRDSAPLTGAITMHRQIKGSHLGIVPDCGHYTIYEKPRVLLGMITDFTRSLTKSGV
jgi:pimeloyl-ACP methyl ester carboxylesterase